MKSRAWLFTLTILNTLIFCFLSMPAVLTDPTPHSLLSTSFFSVTWVAQNFLMACLLSIILLPIFSWVKNDRLKIILSAIPLSVGFLFIYMNAKVFAFWRDYVNRAMLDLYFTKGGSQVFEMGSAMHIWLAAAITLSIILSITTLLLSRKISRFIHTKMILAFLIAIYIVAQSLFLFLCAKDDMRLLQYTIKVPYFYTLSWANALQKIGINPFPNHSAPTTLQSILSTDKALHYPLHPLQYHLPKHPLNVLLIVVDTLRYDMINTTNMPNVTRFAQSADQFLDNNSGGDCTRPGIFSLFYGIPATYWDAALTHHTGSIMIRAFQAAHYQLGIYASAPLLTPPFQKTVFATVKHLQVMTPGDTSLDRDATITHEMQHFLNTESASHKPFFGFLFYDAPHAYNSLPSNHPFHPTEALNYFDINNKTNPTPIFNLYQNAVFADDQLIEKIFLALKNDHLRHNTVVILTADHGQEFNDEKNNYWEHASGFSKYQMRTPMIIAWPHRAPAIIHHQTTHFDLAPTLLKRVLGITNPTSDYSIGDDIFSRNQPSSIVVGNYAYYAWINQNSIMQFHHSGFYRFTNHDMKPLPGKAMTPSELKQIRQEVTAFH